MNNVLKFRSNALYSPAEPVAGGRQGEAAIPDMIARVNRLQSKAKDEIAKSILLLDLAAQHARQIADRIIDPATRKTFELHIASIEDALEVARDRARRL